MGHRMLGAVMTAALLDLAIASVAAGVSLERGYVWPAAVGMAVLGVIVPMIMAVNIRIVPVFSRRDWADPHLVQVMPWLAIVAGWLVFVGRALAWPDVVTLGFLAALGASVLFVVNIGRLFRSPPSSRPSAPLPYPEQARVDRVATGFMRIAILWLLVGAMAGAATAIHPPARGRWDLVWAHALLIGFAFSMASGVTYHVLPRWTTGRWAAVGAIRLHLGVTLVALPLMILALAIDSNLLFHMAAPIQAMVIALWIGNCLPFVRRLPRATGVAFGAAMTALAVGIGLGMSFAVDPANGARLRTVHGEIQLFGWAGLLICGAIYYLVPRFAGAPWRWPRSIPFQLGSMIGGVAAAGSIGWARIFGVDATGAALIAHIWYAAGVVALAAMVMATFVSAGRVPVAPLRPAVRSRG